MTGYNAQIGRIKFKLSEAQKTDRNFKVFGAEKHKYTINKPATQDEVATFEKQFSIQLPDCYRAFIVQVGNGGIGYAGSAAGPFYGIYPLGENIDELICDDTEKYLKADCIIHPKMSDEFWQSQNKELEREDISDEDYSKEIGRIFGGILPIGSQGCSYLHGIILNGPYKGRIVNLDIDRQKPRFTFEHNFLDWYERWLDEVIAGALMVNTPAWFGYCKGGTEEDLLAGFLNAKNTDDKTDCLNGLLNKAALKTQTLDQIATQVVGNPEYKSKLIHLICKSDYQKAKPYLLDLTKTDLLSVFQFVFWYAENKAYDWLPVIREHIDIIDDDDTFRFCTYLLKATGIDYSTIIAPFTGHDNEQIRVTAFYTLGSIPNKKDFIDYFIKGLNDSSNRVIHTTLQALSGLEDNRLLAHYKHLAERFPIEEDYILVNLNHRLAAYGLNNQTILTESYCANIAEGKDTRPRKKWYEIWK